MLIGLYFAKFEQQALEILGFSTFSEAFSTLGLIIGVNPNSLRLYRDEFAPAFPTTRQGYHKREMNV